LNAAMTWAGEQKLRRPRASVMVVLASAGRLDAKLEQRLRRAFSVRDDTGPGVCGAQLGVPGATMFADVPLVQSALLILEGRRVRPWDEISRLLLSPYLGEADAERGARALLDCRMRRRGDVDVAIPAVIDAARNAPVPCPGLAIRLETLTTMRDAMPRRASMQEWMRFAEDLLNAAGWPGDRALNGAEQAALSEWRRVMDAVATLDAVVAACSWPIAFGKWRATLRRRQLSADTDLNAVQVVTLDEAALLDPDALWVAGLHDGAWPEAIETNPLLPFSLQREHGLPGADPELELAHAEAVINCLRTRHPDAIWSYASVEGETPRRPLAGAVGIPVAQDPTAPWPRQAAGARFDSCDDVYAPGLPADAAAGGGVALFSDQAACPFRGFARHRLAAGTPEDASPVLDRRQRGSLIHAVMAAFWRRTKSSAHLAATGEDEVWEILAACVSQVVNEFRVRHRLLDAYWALERTRLADLAREWLSLERGRGEFEVVACEQAGAAQVGAYTVKTRIDRIDRLANGDVVIIDYKTGEVPRTGWSVPRPDQPQLPLYAVGVIDERVAGIAYARIKKGSCRIVDEPRGIMRDGGVASDASAAWAIRQEEWRVALADLADEIASGFALVDPKRGAVTCRYCDLQCLCRIHDPGRATATGDED
jgi:ATP-dependent helicase/nuclease subunit B